MKSEAFSSVGRTDVQGPSDGSFFSRAGQSDTAPPGSSIATRSPAVGQQSQTDAVGMGLREGMSEAEIDAHIKSLGELADRAYKDGDPTGARLWTDRMMAAIRSRSPAHQARMHEEAERRITEGVDYFQSADALALGRRYG